MVKEKKQKSNPDGAAKEPWWTIPLGIIIIIFIVTAIFEAVSTVGSSVKNFFEGNSYKKQQCINRTRNIKNEFTAKKLYKQCMKR